MNSLLLITSALLLVFLNGFFVAAEFSIVKLRHTQVTAIQNKYGLRSKVLARIHLHLDAYLSACQLGITLASLGLGWLGEPAFAYLITKLLGIIGITSIAIIKTSSYMTAFLIISFLHIVAGELMPKSVAIRQSQHIALWTAVPLYGFYWLMYPIIAFLNVSANFLLKSTGLHYNHANESSYSTEELKLILHSSHNHGGLTQEETEILEHTLNFADLKVTDVMQPATDIIALNIESSIKENLDIIANSRYSRYPVCQGNLENIIGVIHIKDLLLVSQNQQSPDLHSLLRPANRIERNMSAIELFRQFRQGITHFALVYSSRDTLIGFVTLDNLLYALIGRMKDEFHRTNDQWELTKHGNLLIKGNSSIYTIERALHIKLPDEDIDTISGLILKKLERLPVQNERIEFDEFTILVEKMTGPRIELVKIYPKKNG